MAISFPTGLDNFTNPSSGNTLDSPSHSLQHSDLNDAVEALEAKLGVGASPAGSASAGQVLTISAAGTSTWSTPTPAGAVALGTATLSGTSTVISSLSQAYRDLIVVVKNANISTAGYILVRPNSSGSTRGWQSRVVGTSYATNSGADLSFDAGTLLKAGDTTNIFILHFFNYAATDCYKSFTAQCGFLTNASARFAGLGQSVYEANTAISSIEWFAQNSMSGGTMTVYGVA